MYSEDILKRLSSELSGKLEVQSLILTCTSQNDLFYFQKTDENNHGYKDELIVHTCMKILYSGRQI